VFFGLTLKIQLKFKYRIVNSNYAKNLDYRYYFIASGEIELRWCYNSYAGARVARACKQISKLAVINVKAAKKEKKKKVKKEMKYAE